jgi:hypothetical protein
MFDAETVRLIAAAPELDGLDLERLPQRLTEIYAQIVAARMRVRQLITGSDLPNDIVEAVGEMRRVASAHEAFVATLPDRADRASAAFVAGAAHHVCLLAERAAVGDAFRPTYLAGDSISPEVAATLLFLIAEATPDAAEMTKQIRWTGDDLVEMRVLSAIADLATGRLERVITAALPTPDTLTSDEPGANAIRALYYLILTGVRALAREMLGDSGTEPGLAMALFTRATELAVETLAGILDEPHSAPFIIFPGPMHLASLLKAVARDLPSCAMVRIRPPNGLEGSRWLALMRQLSQQRPYLWRNHLEALAAGYLETGISSAVSFPTGGGKSKLAELKIAAALLRGVKVVFLAPTLALVDQTASSLARSFSQAQVQREQAEDMLSTLTESEPLPSISVLTPERCLAMLGFTPEVFMDVGLIVFDECHLLHPRNLDTSRRSIDAMLCLLNLNQVCSEADILLLSAMMKNTVEIAGWLEELTGRRCLSLDVKWKPTRQVRGCVVYAADRLTELRHLLTQGRIVATTKGAPSSLKRQIVAQPFGFFCLRQTWVSNARIDYSLLPLLNNNVTLAVGTSSTHRWYLTPNGNQVAAALAAATGHCGLKTLIFTQTIPLSKSAADGVNEIAGPNSILLTEEEEALYKVAVEEVGGAEHLYLKRLPTGRIGAAAACHHGLLILQERQLHEELFRRPNGLSVLVATSTLAQGMNLPSEVVIIAGDSRFDASANRMERLEAFELLNAAGRAGRAGEASQGFVLIVPSKVMDFDNRSNQIHSHWTDLRSIFSQSDQCLDIEDPIQHLLDQIHLSSSAGSDAAQYFLSRLPKGTEFEDGGVDGPATRLLGRSLGAYRARVRADQAWIESRIDTAVRLRRADPSITNTWIDSLSAVSGVPTEVLNRIGEAMIATGILTPPTTKDWCNWLLRWFEEHPADIPVLVRRESLEGMFGAAFKTRTSLEDKGRMAVPVFSNLLPRWMEGATVAAIEIAFGTRPTHLGQCEKAREFVLRIVPELAYVYGLLPQIYAKLFPVEGGVPAALLTIGAAVRAGFDLSEKLALRHVRGRRLNRVAIHQEFTKIAPHLAPAQPGEPFAGVLDRVRNAAALYDYLNS